mmetsp:Transcript_7607/g.18248  ORF Transcript_7607/g.18248 Transcript_7607/m.18248 type:complete len:425 (-) Transcript_7607:59-1333(-)
MRSTMKSTAVGSTPIPVKVLSRRANASGSVGPSAHSRFNTSPSLLKTVTPSWRRVRQLTVQCSSTTPSTDSRTVAEVKEALRRELDGPRSRAVINEILLKLEWKNPTPAPTKSEVLTGGWKFAYYGGIAPGLASSPTRPLALALYAGGFSPGAFGLAVSLPVVVDFDVLCLRPLPFQPNLTLASQVADLLPKNVVETQDFTLCIAGIDPFVSTASINVKTLGRTIPVKVNCELEAESDVRLRETYKSLEVYGRFVEVPASLQYERTMFISYLDDDMMVARDETGAPDILFRIPTEEADKGDADFFKDDPIGSQIASVPTPQDVMSDVQDAAAAAVESMGAAADEAAGSFAGASDSGAGAPEDPEEGQEARVETPSASAGGVVEEKKPADEQAPEEDPKAEDGDEAEEGGKKGGKRRGGPKKSSE